MVLRGILPYELDDKTLWEMGSMSRLLLTEVCAKFGRAPDINDLNRNLRMEFIGPRQKRPDHSRALQLAMHGPALKRFGVGAGSDPKSTDEDAQAGPGIAPEPKPEPEPEPEPEAVPKTESPTRRSRLSSASFLPSALRWPGTLPPAGSADNPFEHQEHLASLGDTPSEGTDKPSMEAA